MNELEELLSAMLDEYGSNPDRMKDSLIEKYTPHIRKAVASEAVLKADVNGMVNAKITYDSKAKKFYRKGITDTLKAIGG